MKRNHLFGVRPFLSVGAVILFVAVYLFSGCSKKENKNPLKPSFETGTVTDVDGNVYRTVKIDNQWWMAENLKVTHYRNGDAIPEGREGGEWMSLTAGAYCHYNGNSNYVDTYGRYYNWYAVIDDRNLAPEGWHIPSAAEWKALIDSLGGQYIAGGKMKEAGTVHWASLNEGATNSSGFSGLPAGYAFADGFCTDMGNVAQFWSTLAHSGFDAWYRGLDFRNSEITLAYYAKTGGNSVRCVKDN